MSYRTGPGVPRSLSELWQFVRREFGAIQREAVRVDTKAQNALEDLTLISDDGKLHPNEKLGLVLRYAQFTGEQAGIEAQATAYGITTAKTAYSAAITNLTNYLNGLTPLWTDITKVTPIDREEFNGYWAAVTDAKQALQNKISERAGERAKWSQTEDDDGQKPEDGATVGMTSAERVLARSRVFFADFSSANYYLDWIESGSGSFGHYTNAAYLQVGAGAAQIDGGKIIYHREKVPFDSQALYRVRARVYIYNADDLTREMYAGLAGFNSAGELCNRVGAVGTVSSQHYVLATGLTSFGAWIELEGYVKGNAAGDGSVSAALGGNHRGSPATMQADVRYIAPIFFCNYFNKTGRTLIDWVSIEKIEVQDQRDLPMVQADVAAVPSGQVCTAVDAGSSATINIAAHSMQFGFGLVSYNSGSISGLAYGTRYYIYCEDPGFNGGSVAYYATTSLATAKGGSWRRHVDTLSTPASGGGSTGGFNPDDCVAEGMWLLNDLLVDDAEAGDLIDVWDIGDADSAKGPIDAIHPAHNVECVRLTMESGAEVVCSVSTPVTGPGPDNEVRNAPDALGMQLGVLHDNEPMVWERVVSVEPVGTRTVYHLSCGNISFAAGTDAAHRVITHNIYYKP